MDDVARKTKPPTNRRSMAGPKVLSEFATTHDVGKSKQLTDIKAKDKRFAVLSVYLKATAGNEDLLENTKLEGIATIASVLDTNTEILAVKYAEEYDKIAVAFTDGGLRLFNSDTMQLENTLIDAEIIKDPAPITAVAHRPVTKQYPIENMFTCTYANGVVKCWNYKYSQCIYTIREQRQTYGIKYHPKVAKFVTYGDNNKIYLYDEETRTQERVFGGSDMPGQEICGPTSRVFAVAFNKRSMYELISGGWDDIIHFWDVRLPTSIRHVAGVHMCGEGLDINSKGTDILACSWQKEDAIQIFDYASGTLKDIIEPDYVKNKYYCCSYMTNEVFVCGGSEPHILKVVSMATRTATGTITNIPGGVYSLDVGFLKQTKNKTTTDSAGLPRVLFCSGKKVYQADFI